MSETDGDFTRLQQVSDEQMAQVEGNHVIYEPTEPDNAIIYIINLGGSQGWIYVYNNGDAEIIGINTVNPDGTVGHLVNVYIHNFHPKNLNDFLKPRPKI